jgi:imidazolonepropionase-like amidohydrolase
MKRRISIALCLLLSILLSPAPAEEHRTIALVGGTLLNGHESPALHHAAVVITGNRIVAVGPRDQVKIPKGAVVIDTRGKTILPGLIDAHIHLDIIGHGLYERYYQFLAKQSSYHEVMRIAAKQLLRAGVTGGIDLGAPLSILDIKKEIDSGKIPGPRLTVSGPWITRVSYEGGGEFEQYLVKSTREAVDATIELIDQGADVIKVWDGLTADDYTAIVHEANKRGAKVHAHLYDPPAIRKALDAGVDVLQHMGSAGYPPYEPELIAEIARKKVPVVQTISHRIWIYPATVEFPGRLDNPTLERDIPKHIYAELQRSFKQIARLPYFSDIEQETRNAQASASQFVDAGAFMGVGTDAASPLNFHTEAMWREMSALVDVGMTPIQVISAATKNNAEIVGRSDELGTIEPGKLADILVVDGDPLFDINVLGYVSFVIKDGVPWYDAANATAALIEVGRSF